MSDSVRITDVAPRDGLQNEPGVIPAEQKAELVRLLCRSCVDEVEVTSFVSPRWVPQLADAPELLRILASPAAPPAAGTSGSPPVIRTPVFSALVPNERGLIGVLEANAAAGRPLISKVAVFTAASETFCARNINASIAESVERFIPVVRGARQAGLRVRGYVSCAVACPFEGPISPDAVVEVALRLRDIGIDELDLGDTIGAGTAESVRRMLETVARRVSIMQAETFTLHLHDTFGRAAECVRVALELGVRSFDGSVAGLGGCPYASTPGRRAPGNISTRTLVQTILAAGFRTGVDISRLDEAAGFATAIVGQARLRAASEAPP